MDPGHLTTTIGTGGWAAILSVLVCLSVAGYVVLWRQHLDDQAKLAVAEAARRMDLLTELEKRAALEMRHTDALSMIAATSKAQLENSTKIVGYIVGERQ